MAQAHHTYPNVLITDGGLEFVGQMWDNFFNQHNITHRTTNPGSPTENALAERTNRTIRYKLNELMVRNNSNEWLANLQLVCDSINNNIVSGTHHTPNDLWTPGYQAGHQVLPNNLPPPSDNDNQLMIRARMMQKNRDRWQQVLNNDRNRRFLVVDHVFLSVKALSTVIRQYLKNGLGSTKNIPVKYVPRRLRIYQVHPAAGFTKEKYNVRNDQNAIVMKNGQPWDLYASQLVHVPPGSTPTGLNPASFQRAMRINNFPADGNHQAFMQQPPVPPVPPADNQQPPPPPPAPRLVPVTQWHSKECNDALKGKQFTDFDEDEDGNRIENPPRCVIVKVLYDRREKAYLVDYVKVGVQPVVRNMNQALLGDVLGLARGEDWWQEGFEEVVRRG